ncbi:hypothetical protein ACJOMP_04320, partial [Mycoplasmopsis synoviae]
APTTQSDSTAAAVASATVRVTMGEDSAAEGAQEEDAQAPQAPTTPDLASTASYLKSLIDSLKAESDKLNGDTTENKTAYYKSVDGRILYWDWFIPKIVLTD